MKRSNDNLEHLKAIHEPHSIRERLSNSVDHDYLGDGILGGIDGAITTFAIVAGTLGGGFPSIVALALGLSNLIADGLSMAVSNYQATSSLKKKVEQIRKEEILHTQLVPEGEREEIRQIFAQKGFEGEVLEHIVEVITSDVDRWVDTMIQEEHGLPLSPPCPLKSAWTTFIWFLVVGVIPLIPFFFIHANYNTSFIWSIGLTCAAFIGIGVVKGFFLRINMMKEALSVLLLGGTAALVSFGISHWVTAWVESFV